MNSRIQKASEYDAKAKKLRREEQAFWREVSDRRTEILEHLGISVEILSERSDTSCIVMDATPATLGEPTISADTQIHSGLSIGETDHEGVM